LKEVDVAGDAYETARFEAGVGYAAEPDAKLEHVGAGRRTHDIAGANLATLEPPTPSPCQPVFVVTGEIEVVATPV
jgi:hypothetical protein